MGKRFTDDLKWQDPWYRKLSGPAKLLWHYLTDHADPAGVVEIDYELATEDCRLAITPAHMAELGSRVQIFNGAKVLITKFIPFQYGRLSETCHPHRRVFDAIAKHGLIETETGYMHPDGTDAPMPEKKPSAKREAAKPASKSRPADRAELDAYFREVDLLPRDAEYAWEKWEGNGWLNGGKPIKDWKSTVRQWKTGGYWPTQKNVLPSEKQWTGGSVTKPSWMPENWREIAISIIGDEAERYTSPSQIPPARQYEFEMACRERSAA